MNEENVGKRVEVIETASREFGKRGTIVAGKDVTNAYVIVFDNENHPLRYPSKFVRIDEEESMLFNIYRRYERIRAEALMDAIKCVTSSETLDDAKTKIKAIITANWRQAFEGVSSLKLRMDQVSK